MLGLFLVFIVNAQCSSGLDTLSLPGPQFCPTTVRQAQDQVVSVFTDMGGQDRLLPACSGTQKPSLALPHMYHPLQCSKVSRTPELARKDKALAL